MRKIATSSRVPGRRAACTAAALLLVATMAAACADADGAGQPGAPNTYNQGMSGDSNQSGSQHPGTGSGGGGRR